MERELGDYLVQWFQNTKTVEELRMCFHVIRQVVSTSAERASNLMADGFSTAAAEVLTQMRGSRRRSRDDWSLAQQFVLTTLILVWNWSEPVTGMDWATGSLLSAISPATIQLAGRINARLNPISRPQPLVKDSATLGLESDINQTLFRCGEHLLRLIEGIRQRQPVEALIARNLDVTLNHLALSRNISLNWRYEVYTARSSSLRLCSSLIYLQDGML